MKKITKGALLASAHILAATSANSVAAAEYPKGFQFVYSASGTDLNANATAKESVIRSFSLSIEQLKDRYKTLDQIKGDFKDIREVGLEVSGNERYQLQMRYRESDQHPEFIRNIEFLVQGGAVIDIQTFGYM